MRVLLNIARQFRGTPRAGVVRAMSARSFPTELLGIVPHFVATILLPMAISSPRISFLTLTPTGKESKMKVLVRRIRDANRPRSMRHRPPAALSKEEQRIVLPFSPRKMAINGATWKI